MDTRTDRVRNDSISPAARRTSATRFGYGVSVLLAAFFLLAGCEREVIVPKFLLGEWKTAAPKYADRTITFTEHSVIYGIGAGEKVIYTIDRVDDKQSDAGTMYTFFCRDAEGQKHTLRYTYRFGFGETLQIVNSKAIWEKTGVGQTGR